MRDQSNAYAELAEGFRRGEVGSADARQEQDEAAQLFRADVEHSSTAAFNAWKDDVIQMLSDKPALDELLAQQEDASRREWVEIPAGMTWEEWSNQQHSADEGAAR